MPADYRSGSRASVCPRGRFVPKTKWTDEEVNRLKELVQAGVSPARCSVIFKRRTITLKQLARKLGTPFPAQQREKSETRRF
jgi:hypothetical protein